MADRPIRIAHIDTERTWRGGEQQAYSLIDHLRTMGHVNVGVVRAHSPFHKRLEAAGVPVCAVRPLGEWDVRSAFRVNRYLKNEKIDVCHAHTAHGAALAALATVATGIPVVATRRVDFHLASNPFSKWKYGRAAVIAAISQNVRRVLVEDGVPLRKIEVVPSGLDFSRFRSVRPLSRAAMGVRSGSILIGQIAALADHKDQVTFVRAIRLLRDGNSDVQALLVGEGDQRSRLESLIADLDLSGAVLLAGFKANPLDYCASFDIFCLSSKLEGLGTSVLEAMALKVPVVATRSGGIPEIIQEGVTGFLAEPRNPPALADALKKAFSLDSASKRAMIEDARQKVSEYDVIHTVSKTEALYRRLCPSTELST